MVDVINEDVLCQFGIIMFNIQVEVARLREGLANPAGDTIDSTYKDVEVLSVIRGGGEWISFICSVLRLLAGPTENESRATRAVQLHASWR
jgi:hypothetical protein